MYEDRTNRHMRSFPLHSFLSTLVLISRNTKNKNTPTANSAHDLRGRHRASAAIIRKILASFETKKGILKKGALGFIPEKVDWSRSWQKSFFFFFPPFLLNLRMNFKSIGFTQKQNFLFRQQRHDCVSRNGKKANCSRSAVDQEREASLSRSRKKELKKQSRSKEETEEERLREEEDEKSG